MGETCNLSKHSMQSYSACTGGLHEERMKMSRVVACHIVLHNMSIREASQLHIYFIYWLTFREQAKYDEHDKGEDIM